ncbi:uncharacterized protein SOCEGT47_002610 [Sorangium cellulosum]|uniref:Uncharacterized protein n=1 Tax=Sorangium cellulosum TaxID=56 RepID=A0A4P2PTC1_SORCE|nr:uncharacterized protein SOCEGT47_002610 [Sorangium cellulosum]
MRGGKKAPKRPPVVLVFGEDENDRESIKILLEALCPALARRVQTRRHPLVLIKSARPIDYVGKNVGRIRNAKEELKRRVVPSDVKSGQRGFRGYRESDAPRIAAEVSKLGLANAPQASSGSYDHFRRSVGACSAGARPAPKGAHPSRSR